jgi:hypothetical protein
MTPQEIRAHADGIVPRVHEDGRINATHVAIEQSLRNRYGHPNYIAELDGPGNFRPQPVSHLVRCEANCAHGEACVFRAACQEGHDRRVQEFALVIEDEVRELAALTDTPQWLIEIPSRQKTPGEMWTERQRMYRELADEGLDNDQIAHDSRYRSLFRNQLLCRSCGEPAHGSSYGGYGCTASEESSS